MAHKSKKAVPKKVKTPEAIEEEKGKFSPATKDELQRLNAFRCANPDCRQYTLEQKLGGGLYTTGQAAHIEGNGKKAARHNAKSTPGQRSDITNGLWLCTRCHSMVDPDPHRYPVALLRKWKDMSEHILNYSSPIMAFGNRCFFNGKVVPGPQRLGGHLTIGPSNLDGICMECWTEGLSSTGKFKIHADRFYENKNTGVAIAPISGDDWHPFLTHVGLDHLTYFSGPVPGYKNFLAYRVGVTYQITGRDFVFHSPWQLGGLKPFQEEIFHFNRKTGVLLAPWIDWIFGNPNAEDAQKMLAIFDYPTLHVRRYSWKESCDRFAHEAIVWKSDGRGAETCQGEIDGGVTFGFIQEAIKTALVISTKGPPTDKLITTDEPAELITINAQD